ncbi:hypothetical protein AVEN_7852-1, partial [Araneus ventricosus]
GLCLLLSKAQQPPGGLRCNPPGFAMQTLLASLATVKTLGDSFVASTRCDSFGITM